MKRIKVCINKTERDYDVYALLTSFFPGTEVVTSDEEGEFDGRFLIEENEENVSISLSFEEINSSESFVLLYSKKEDIKK